MDLYLYARVLWRFRLLVAAGLALALALATLSVLRIGTDGVSYRDSRLWSANMKVAVTQRGCPECRLYAQYSSRGSDSTSTPVSPGQPVTDPARLATLARYYAQLLTSDPVRLRAERSGSTGEIVATPIRDDQSGVILPYIDILSISTTAEGAIKYADASVRALGAYLLALQRSNNVEAADRVIIEPIVVPEGASVYRPRPKTMPIVVFLAVMFAIVGLAFVLENARPRARRLDPESRSELPKPEQHRRSA
jgi:hypothetical protein